MTEPEGPTVYVFQSESGQYRVWPPVLVVPSGVQAFVCNFTPGDLLINNPERGRPAAFRLGPIRPGAKVPLPAISRGAHPYEVEVNGFRAVGHSDPSIIVD